MSRLTKESTERDLRKFCGKPRARGPTGEAGRVGTSSGEFMPEFVDLAVVKEVSEARDVDERRVEAEGARSGRS